MEVPHADVHKKFVGSAVVVTTFRILLAPFVPVSAENPPIKPPLKVQVGVILPMTSPFARYTGKIRTAISAATAENISFLYENGGCEPKIAINAYNKLAHVEKVRLFTGP